MERELTLQQEAFCKNYVSEEFFGNGTQAYINAYNIDLAKKGAYESARAKASENLTKPNICKRINDLLDEAGLNDQFVDKQLLFLINQHADFGAKVSAIKEYNKLKQRVESKMTLTTKTITVIAPNDNG